MANQPDHPVLYGLAAGSCHFGYAIHVQACMGADEPPAKSMDATVLRPQLDGGRALFVSTHAQRLRLRRTLAGPGMSPADRSAARHASRDGLFQQLFLFELLPTTHCQIVSRPPLVK